MKKQLSLLLLLGVITLSVVAQKNVFKIHTLPFAWGEMRLGYERVLTPKLALQFNYGTFLSSRIPSPIYETSSVETYLNTTPIKNKLSGFSTSMDLRIYTKSEAPARFYIAPYIKYNRYNVTASASFEYSADTSEYNQLTQQQQSVGGYQNGNYHYDVTGTLNGTISQFGVGASIGFQFLVAKVLTIDLNFFGLGVEYNKVNADLTTNVRGVDYEKWLPYVRDEVEDIPYIGDDIKLTAEQDRIKMEAPIVLPTFRASIGIGLAF